MKQEIDNNAMWATFRQELALQGELQVVSAIDNALNDLGFTIEETSTIIPIPLKQSEQMPTLPKWKYKKDHTPLLRDSIILNKYGCVAKSPSGAIVSDVWVLDYDELAKLPKEEFEKQGEQKPTWSEEDENYCLDVNAAVSDYFDEGYAEELKDWLKSLKERIGE